MDVVGAKQAMAEGRYNDALPVLVGALADDPDDLEVACALASCHLALGDPSAALEVANDATATHPGDAKPYLLLAEALRRSGRPSDALSTYEEAARLAPGEPGPLEALGRQQLAMGQLEAATETARRLRSAAPFSSASRNLEGRVLLKAGHAGDAEDMFREALEMDPSDPVLFNNLAVAQVAQGRVTDSVGSYVTAATLDPRPNYLGRDLEALLDRYLNPSAIVGFLLPLVLIGVAAGILLAAGYEALSLHGEDPSPITTLVYGVCALYAVSLVVFLFKRRRIRHALSSEIMSRYRVVGSTAGGVAAGAYEPERQIAYLFSAFRYRKARRRTRTPRS